MLFRCVLKLIRVLEEGLKARLNNENMDNFHCKIKLHCMYKGTSWAEATSTSRKSSLKPLPLLTYVYLSGGIRQLISPVR